MFLCFTLGKAQRPFKYPNMEPSCPSKHQTEPSCLHSWVGDGATSCLLTQLHTYKDYKSTVMVLTHGMEQRQHAGSVLALQEGTPSPGSLPFHTAEVWKEGQHCPATAPGSRTKGSVSTAHLKNPENAPSADPMEGDGWEQRQQLPLCCQGQISAISALEKWGGLVQGR